MIINHPHLGPRDASEFSILGDASLINRPDWQAGDADAWGEVTERTFERMVVKPDWGIRTFTHEDGKDHLVEVKTIVERPFASTRLFSLSMYM